MCPCWTGLCPGASLGGTTLIPVHVPAGSSQQRSSSQCPLPPSPAACLHPPGVVCCCCRCCSCHQPWLTELDKPSSRPCSPVESFLHLYSTCSCFCPAFFSTPTYPSSSRCPAPGQGHFPPPGFPVLWGEVWSEARGWVSVCLSLSRSRLRSGAGRAALASIHAVQPALPTGF